MHSCANWLQTWPVCEQATWNNYDCVLQLLSMSFRALQIVKPQPPILILCFWQHIPAYWPAFWLCVYWTGFTPSQSAYNLVWTAYKLVKGLKSGCNIYTWWYMHTNTENVRNHKQFVGRHTYTPGRAFLSSCNTLPSSGSIRYCSSALSPRRTVKVVTPL